MNHFLLIPLFAAFINLALALFVFTRDIRLRLNQVFLLWGVSLSVWNFGAFMLFRVNDAAAALTYARVTHMGVIFIPISVLHLSALLTRRKLGGILFAGYAASILLAFSNLTDSFIVSARYIGYAWFAVPGPAYWGFLLVFTAATYPALFMIWKARRRSQGPIEAKRFNALLIADTLLLTMGSNDLLPLFGFGTYPLTNIPVYPWGQFAACWYGLFVGYSVMHDQLLDIRVSIGRQAATLVRLFFLTAVCYSVFLVGVLLFPGSFNLTGLAIALAAIVVGATVASVFFPRIIGVNTERLERHILGDRFEYQVQLRAFATSINDGTDRDKMMNDTLVQLRDVMGLASSQIVVLDDKTQEIKSAHGLPTASVPLLTPANLTPVFDYFRLETDRLDFRNPQNGILAKPHEYRARQALAVINPEFSFAIRGSGQLLGVMVFGAKRRETPFTQIDIEVGEMLAVNLGRAFDRIQLKERTAFLEKNELLAVMGAGLAHDLRNRLQPIITYLQLKGEMEMDEGEAALFRTAVSNTDVIRSYIDASLFFSRGLRPAFALTNISDVLAAAKGVVRPERGHCQVVVEDKANCEIMCDASMLHRVIDNLVGNSMDASADGQVVRVRAEVLPQTVHRDKWIRIQVIDEGAGIPPELLSRVFEPYFSTKNTGDKTRGFGLGLSTVQRLVYLHGGAVSIKSNPGAGTTVQVELPALQNKIV